MLPINSTHFQHSDVFRHTLQFMGFSDFVSCMQVCKLWNKFSENPSTWQQLFKNEGIPLVEQRPKSNLKEEFRILKPTTISGAIIKKLFGNFPEEIPCIRREIFEKFFQADPFEPEKLMMETFKIVVIPSVFERISCAEFPYILDQKGKLQRVQPGEWTGEKLLISNNIPNLKILCEHPLSGKENMPVFDDFHHEVLNQCNTQPDKISLCFMRTCIVGRNMSYSEQETLIQGREFKATSLGNRVFFDAVCILTSGTCPDVNKPRLSFARTCDVIVFGGKTYPVGIGSFIPGRGASVSQARLNSNSGGVVPCISAEAPR